MAAFATDICIGRATDNLISLHSFDSYNKLQESGLAILPFKSNNRPAPCTTNLDNGFGTCMDIKI